MDKEPKEERELPQRLYTAAELRDESRLNPMEHRTLCRTGYLKPAHTGAGWVVHGERDLARAKAWVEKRRGQRG